MPLLDHGRELIPTALPAKLSKSVLENVKYLEPE